MSTAAPVPAPAPASRLASVDAYRGFVMFLMMAEVLHLGSVSRALPGSGFWRFLAGQQTHAPWTGCTLHDLIQPSFSFLVGVALPFSIASRLARGQSVAGMTVHAFARALILILLGIFLRSVGAVRTNFTFEDTLTQIGLGYGLLFCLGFRSVRWQWSALGVVLFGYWLAFALYPLPGPDFNWQNAGVPPDWAHNASGFAAHWNKNTNLAWAFDTWFLNLFPRAKPFLNNGGGYATLSFIPTLGTMILGLIAGGVLRGEETAKARQLARLGAACLAAGLLWHWSGTCPSVKRIWTPSWTLFSGGWCFLLLAGFYVVIDVRQWRSWAFVFQVVGMNSIAAYCIAHLWEGFIAGSLKTHLGSTAFTWLGDPYQRLLEGAAVLAVLWLVLLWMYRRKLFLRI